MTNHSSLVFATGAGVQWWVYLQRTDARHKTTALLEGILSIQRTVSMKVPKRGVDKIVSYALREYLLIFSNRNDKGSTLSLLPSFIPPLDLPFSPSVPFYSPILIFITLLFPLLSKNSCFVSFPLFFLLLLPSYLPPPPSHPAFSLSLSAM